LFVYWCWLRRQRLELLRFAWILEGDPTTKNAYTGLALSITRGTVAVDFDREEALVDDVTETIDDAGAVEINPLRTVHLQRIEACALRERVLRTSHGVSPQGFEQRMPRRNPL